MNRPLEPGENGWGNAHVPSLYVPERHAEIDNTTRRWPQAIRLLGRDILLQFPRPSEDDLFGSVRELILPEVRTAIHRMKPDRSRDPTTQKLIEWVDSCRPLSSWWRGTWGWRSPREFASYRKLEVKLKAPHIEPFEAAHWRIPDDISGDLDVVVFIAWCQGVMVRHLEGEPAKNHHQALRRGLAKFHRSPWVAFAFAAPHMQPTGVMFAGAGYLNSCDRLGYLLRHPYEATDGELERILVSPMFEAGYASARKVRKAGAYMNPDGTWYACRERSKGLGTGFRRGGTWTAARRGVR